MDEWDDMSSQVGDDDRGADREQLTLTLAAMIMDAQIAGEAALAQDWDRAKTATWSILRSANLAHMSDIADNALRQLQILFLAERGNREGVGRVMDRLARSLDRRLHDA